MGAGSLKLEVFKLQTSNFQLQTAWNRNLPEKRKQTRRASAARKPDDTDFGFRRRRTTVRVRRRPGERGWELVHPRCVQERMEDLEEVQQMLAAGEVEIAIDELRWLLDGCGDFIAAHRLLGELALADGDLKLARGHFGYAYEIGLSALPPRGFEGPLPHRLAANQPLLESAKGLAWCLHELGKNKLARRVLVQLLLLDSTDPLGVRAWQSAWQGEG